MDLILLIHTSSSLNLFNKLQLSHESNHRPLYLGDKYSTSFDVVGFQHCLLKPSTEFRAWNKHSQKIALYSFTVKRTKIKSCPWCKILMQATGFNWFELICRKWKINKRRVRRAESKIPLPLKNVNKNQCISKLLHSNTPSMLLNSKLFNRSWS